MKLNEVLEMTEGTIFLGSKAGFMFIGTAEELKLIEKRLNRKLKQNLTDLAAQYRRNYERLKDIDEVAAEKELVRLNNAKESKKLFKPVTEREVTEVRKRYKNDGTIIMIEGDEVGRFWLRTEFEEELKKERKKIK